MPAGVAWNENFSEYCPIGGTFTAKCLAEEWDARLDTFTRCQETTDVYVSLIQEMVMDIEGLAIAAYGCVPQQSQDILDRAKQIMGDKK